MVSRGLLVYTSGWQRLITTLNQLWATIKIEPIDHVYNPYNPWTMAIAGLLVGDLVGLSPTNSKCLHDLKNMEYGNIVKLKGYG